MRYGRETKTTLTALAIGLLTIPRLVINYGLDYDCNAAAHAAEKLYHTGIYSPSRFPGYPLFEYLLAFIIPFFGYVGSNLFVLASFIIGIWIFSKLAKDRVNATALTIIFALTPILLLNSTTTIDYIPGLTLLLLSYYLTVNKRYTAATIILGLAMGFRITNILFLLPLALYMKNSKVNITKILSNAALTLVIGVSLYLPVFLRYGFKMLNPGGVFQIYSLPMYLARTGYELFNVFGLVATLVILIIIGLKFRVIMKSTKELLNKSSEYLAELSAIMVFLLLFLVHSDEGDYLIPAIPFIYLFLERFVTRRELILMGLTIVSFAFINIETKGGASGQRNFNLHLDRGILVGDYRDRNELELLRDGIGSFPGASKAVILTGMGPDLTYKNKFLEKASYPEISPQLDEQGIWGSDHITKLTGKNVFLVYALSKNNCTLLQKDGWKIYIFSEHAPAIVYNAYKYDPFNIGIEKLEVLNRNAFYK